MKTNRLVCLLALVVLSSAVITISAQTTPAKQENYFSNLPKRYFDTKIDTSNWPLTNKENELKIEFIVGDEQPSKIAYFPGNDDPTNHNLDGPEWKPLNPTEREVILDLGSQEGDFHFRFAAEWEHPFLMESGGEYAVVDRTPPIIVITYPTNRITSQPWLQVLGYANEQLFGIHYDVVNSSETSANHDGFVSDQYFDKAKFDFTTNYFQCYDIALAPGTNQIVLRCNDTSGNQSTTNIEIVFSTAEDTNPPIMTPIWPANGMDITSPTFTARGSVDDYTATLKGIISGGGKTNEIDGMIERTGTFWVENIPLLADTNNLLLIATDAAGNSSMTNLTLYKSDVDLAIDSTPSGQDLYKPFGLVTGHVKPGYDVYVNGAKAVVEPNGHWHADKTPIYGMGTATFDVTAVPAETSVAAKTTSDGLKNILSSTANLGQEPIVLNPSQAACGNFSIHLTGTSGKSFVLLNSTNLVRWTPILTNLNSAASFDFTDTNAANYPCRFFRVVPLP